MIFLYISWSFCKIIVSFFFLFSLPFPHSNAAETYLLQFMMSFLWRWKRGQVDHVVWHLVGVGCDDDDDDGGYNDEEDIYSGDDENAVSGDNKYAVSGDFFTILLLISAVHGPLAE